MAMRAAKAAITLGPYVVSHWSKAVQLMAVGRVAVLTVTELVSVPSGGQTRGY